RLAHVGERVRTDERLVAPLDAGHDAMRLRQQLQAIVRQAYSPGSPVALVRFAHEQSALLELLDELADRLLRDAHALRQFGVSRSGGIDVGRQGQERGRDFRVAPGAHVLPYAAEK